MHGCRPARSTIWSRRSASTPASPSPKSAGSAPTSMGAVEEHVRIGRVGQGAVPERADLDRWRSPPPGTPPDGSPGVTADGRREVLGFDVGDSEDGAFWTANLGRTGSRRPLAQPIAG
jgi:hypothetical protein